MAKKENLTDRKKRFAQIWLTSRNDAGKTQEYMAKGLGVSTKTVQNWEYGTTAPDLFTGSEWFRILGVNPFPYYLSYIFPDLFDGITPADSDDTIDQAIKLLVDKMTMTEKRQLLFLMAGRHGSSWFSLLQMFTAHCHTSMKSRVKTARTILDAYEMEEANGELVCPENVRPDTELLLRSIEEGKKAVMSGDNGYTSIKKEESR